jgi:hypothetical protein
MAIEVIYRGPVAREAQAIDLPVVGAYFPGIVVNINSTNKLVAATTGTGRLLILSNRRFIGQDIRTAYAVNETGVAYCITPEQQYCVKVATGTYTQGQELTVGAGGVLKAAVAGNVVNFFFDRVIDSTASAEGFADVVVANFYTKA